MLCSLLSFSKRRYMLEIHKVALIPPPDAPGGMGVYHNAWDYGPLAARAKAELLILLGGTVFMSPLWQHSGRCGLRRSGGVRAIGRKHYKAL